MSARYPESARRIAVLLGAPAGVGYQAALNAGDADAIVDTFAPDGYYREPIGPPLTHRGTAELRSFFTRCFSAGGGIGQEHCTVTDDRDQGVGIKGSGIKGVG